MLGWKHRTKYKLGGLNHSNGLPDGLGNWVTIWAELVPSEAAGAPLFHASPVTSHALLTIFGAHWLVAAKLQPSHGVLIICGPRSAF